MENTRLATIAPSIDAKPTIESFVSLFSQETQTLAKSINLSLQLLSSFPGSLRVGKTFSLLHRKAKRDNNEKENLSLLESGSLN
jgi:hypothetical protein